MAEKENELVLQITKDTAMIVPIDDPSPIAYINLFDEGDIWIKSKGCDECPLELKLRCCGECPCVLPDGRCYWHSGNPHGDRGDMKPFRCIRDPSPKDGVFLFCSLEFKCIVGPHEGKVRRLKDRLHILYDPKTGGTVKTT